jgi:hypothetical protein
LAKDDHKYQGSQEWLHKEPERTQDRLLVDCHKISFYEQQEQFAVRPEFFRMAAQWFARVNDKGGLWRFCAFGPATEPRRSQSDGRIGVFGVWRIGHKWYRGVQNLFTLLCKAVSVIVEVDP